MSSPDNSPSSENNKEDPHRSGFYFLMYVLFLLSMVGSLGVRTLRSTHTTPPCVCDQRYWGDATYVSQKSTRCIGIPAPLHVFESTYTQATTTQSMNKDVNPQEFANYIALSCTLSALRTSGCSIGRMIRADSDPAPQTTMSDDYAAKIRRYPEKRMAPLGRVEEIMDPSRLHLERQGVHSSQESAVELRRDPRLIIVARSDRGWCNRKTTLNSSNVLCSGTVRGNRKCHHIRQSDHIYAEEGVRLRLKTCQLPTSNMLNGVQNRPKFKDTEFGRLCNDESAIGLALLALANGCLLFFYVKISFSKVAGPGSLGEWDKPMLQVLCQFIGPTYAKPKHRRSRRLLVSPLRSSVFQLLSLSVTAVYLFARPIQAAQDLRGSIINGMEPCFRYTMDQSLFRMNCSVLHWQAQGYGPDTHISLSANETFDGGGTPDNEESYVELSGIIDFEGLFTVKDVEVTTFNEAPVIRNVHVKNGTVAQYGGFIVRGEQKYFIVDSCSSSGDIVNYQAGGICGYKSGLSNGEIKILNSYSTGKIKGSHAGGITGSEVGYNGGIVHITECYSIGDIEKSFAGGICGYGAGRQDGQVYIKQSYSTGDIVSAAQRSGGIVGGYAGYNKGYVEIQESYTTGQILSDYSGGVTGSYAAYDEGKVHIIDCYTRGDIDGDWAGGISGVNTGGCCSGIEDFGDVNITNTYASGIVKHVDAGGIIGRIDFDFQGHTIHVKYSVYNDPVEGRIIGQDDANHLDETGNSNDLIAIRGQLYRYGGLQRWDNNTWVINGTDTLPILRFQIPLPSASPRPTSTRTPTTSMTSSKTPSPTRTSTTIGTHPPTVTRTASRSATETPTPTTTNSRTETPTPTTSRTETSSQTETSTSTPTGTATTTGTETSSSSRLPSSSKSDTSTLTSTSSASRTSTSSSSHSPTVTQSKSPRPQSEKWRILPVQRAQRSVRQHLTTKKRRRRQVK